MLQKMIGKMGELETKVHGGQRKHFKVGSKVKPKMANRGEDTAGHVDAAIIGENFVHNQRQDIRAMPHSKTV